MPMSGQTMPGFPCQPIAQYTCYPMDGINASGYNHVNGKMPTNSAVITIDVTGDMVIKIAIINTESPCQP